MRSNLNQRSKKKKQQPSQKLLAAQAAHRKFLASMRISPVKRGTKLRGLSSNFSDLSVTSNVAPLSNTIPGSGAKKSLDDYKWKKDQSGEIKIDAYFKYEHSYAFYKLVKNGILLAKSIGKNKSKIELGLINILKNYNNISYVDLIKTIKYE
mgnify:CR=1 FL=1